MPNEAPSPNLFTGEYRHGLDAKNRITVPAAWRSEEENCELYIKVGNGGSCLQVFTKGAYMEAWEKFKYHPDLSPEQREGAARLFTSDTFRCGIDKQGRMVLPPHLCQTIDTTGGVTLVGATDRFEVWNPQRWEETKAAQREAFERLSKSLGL